MALLHFLVSLLMSIYNPETTLCELEGLERVLPPFEGERLEWVWTTWLALISSRASP